MFISIIVAVAENGVIGRGGKCHGICRTTCGGSKAAHDGAHNRHGPADVGIDRPTASRAGE
jgi:hypothetical protein